ncbi:MAG: cytochrome [Bdellovibrionota bacterium]|mgnify:CR=1 FL=1
MFLQGDLQAMFDALYVVGAIDPVLKMDWEKVTKEMAEQTQLVNKAFQDLNKCSGDRGQLIQKLSLMDTKIVNYVALEVAREFCEFQDRRSLQ